MRKHLHQYLYTGWSVGVVVGTLDAAVRIYSRHFEWFEIYTALLLPGLFFALAGLVIGVSGELLCEYFKGDESLRSALSQLLLAPVLLTLYLLAMFLTQALRKESLIERLLEGAAVIVVAVAAAIFTWRIVQAGAARRILRSSAYGSLRRWGGAFVVSATGFMLFSFVVDLYNLLFWLPTDQHQAANEGYKKPWNVVLITLDTVRADHLSLYGYEKPTTPFLQKFSERAVVFEDAVSTTSWTLPSHASIFTGLRLSEHSAHTNHQNLRADFLTLAEILKNEGYRTAGFVGGPYCKAKFGLSQGFDVYRDRLDFFEWNTTFDRFSLRRIFDTFSPDLWKWISAADGERSAEEINSDVFQWLDQGSAPFFLFVNYFDAHDPYDSAEEFLGLFTDERMSYSEVDQVLDDIYYGGPARYEVHRVNSDLKDYMKALYDSEIRKLDAAVRTLVKRLDEKNLLQNTLFIITSDHGEEFFEHGGVLHRQTLYEEVLSVPLIVRMPGMRTQRRVQRTVGTVDIFSSVLDALGVQSELPSSSRSFLKDLQGSSSEEDHPVISELYGNKALGGVDLASVTKSGWKYIASSRQMPRVGDRLYNRHQDRIERQSVLKKRKGRAKKMRRELETAVPRVQSW